MTTASLCTHRGLSPLLLLQCLPYAIASDDILQALGRRYNCGLDLQLVGGRKCIALEVQGQQNDDDCEHLGAL